MKHKLRGKEQGFSMLEFVLSTGISIVIMGMGMSLLHQGQRMVTSQDAKITAQAKARKAVNLITSDIRITGCSPIVVSNVTNVQSLNVQGLTQGFSGVLAGVVAAKTNSIRIVGDRQGTGLVANGISGSDFNDDVEYSFANGQIMRYARNDASYNGVAVVLSDNVNNLSFRYYDRAGVELSVPTNGLAEADRRKIARIDISLSINIVENGKVVRSITIDNPIAIRNRIIDID